MKKLNNLESLNCRSQREIKTSSKPQKNENFKSLKINKKFFPILHSLYNADQNNFFFYDKNSSLKRSSTEDFKNIKSISDTINIKLLDEEEEEEKNNNEKQEQNNKENKKYKNKKKFSRKKKQFNNSKKEKNKDFYDYNSKSIKFENLMNTITVKEAKELKKEKNNLKSRAKPKIKTFKNIKIVRPNNEVNIDPLLKVFSNVDIIHQFEEKIGPITNKRFKDLEMVQESEEKLNLNSIKRFDNMEICQTEKDFHVIDIKNKNYIISDTISENFSYENIQEKIFSKIEVNHINDINFNPINKIKRFTDLEILKEKENFSIEPNFKKRESFINIEENKEDNNNNNINTNNDIENGLLFNNINPNDNENSIQSHYNNIIENENNIKPSQNEILITNQKESDINNNKNIQNGFEDSKENNKPQKTSTKENYEFNCSEQGQFNQIYLKDIKANIINSNPRRIDYSQINNQYDSDSRNFNNITNLEKMKDKSSIEPIKNDSQNYSKLIEGIEKGEFNIYSNKNNIPNDKNENPIKENKKSTDAKYKDKNCFTFHADKSNNSIKIKNEINKSKHKTNTLPDFKRKNSNKNNKKSNQKKINKRNSDNTLNNMKKESNGNNNKNYQISINSNNNQKNKDNFSNPISIKENDKSSEQDLSETNGNLQKNLTNVPNSSFPKRENNLNKIVYNSTNNINIKKIKMYSEGMNNKNKNKEDSFGSSYVRSKNSLFNGSRKSTQKQEEIK